MKGSDRGDIPVPPRVPRGARKGLILGFTTSHTNQEMLRPILTMFPGGPCSMVFSFYFQLNSKASILWLIRAVDGGEGRRASSRAGLLLLRPRDVPTAGTSPRIAPLSLLSPAPAEAQRGPSSGPTFPHNTSLGKKSRSLHSQTSEVSSQVLFIKYIYFLWEIVIPLFKKKKKIPSEPESLRLVLSKRKMFYLLPFHSFCVFFFFFPLLHISWFVMIPHFEASYIRLLLFCVL